MKKLKLIFPILLMVIALIPQALQADTFDLDCEEFELAQINQDGTLSTVACYADFTSAKKAMAEKDNYLIRHKASLSATKIIAMNNGVAYSYPYRAERNTLLIYERADFKTRPDYKTTYINGYIEMRYLETVNYDAQSGDGTVHVVVNGFDGYVKLKCVDLVPEAFMDAAYPILLGGNENYFANPESAYYFKPQHNYYLVKERKGRRELEFHFSRAFNDSNDDPEPTVYTIVLDEAPVGLATNQRYYSADGYNFYADPLYEDYVLTYYPYYQFLPLRSKSNLSGEDLDAAFKALKGNVKKSALKDTGSEFKKAEELYGVNALLLYALAVHESAWGLSPYALERNNLFGWAAYDADPDNASYFASIAQCINEQAGLNLRYFLDIDDWRFFSMSLGNKGSGVNVKYASDPYWGQKIAAIAYSIDKAVSGRALKDHHYYDFSLIKDFGINFYYRPHDENSKIYAANYGTKYQENFLVIPLFDEGEFTAVQFSNPIAEGKYINTYTDGLIPYDFKESIAYVKSEHLKKVNQISKLPYHCQSLDVSLHAADLKLAGQVQIEGIPTAEYRLFLEDGKEFKKELKLEANEQELSFSAEIALNELKEGDYLFYLTFAHPQAPYRFVLPLKGQEATSYAGDRKYRLTADHEKSLQLTISAYDVKHFDMLTIEELTMQDEKLVLKGLAFESGFDFTHDRLVKHELEIYQLADRANYKTYPLVTSAVNDFSLNDEFTYRDIAFNGSIDLSELPYGNYGLRLKITNGEEQFSFNLSTTKSEFMRQSFTAADKTYLLQSNQIYRRRMELDIVPADLPYAQINIPTYAPSIINIDSLKFQADKLVFAGQAYIRRADFGMEDKVEYNFTLLAKDGAGIYPFTVNKIANAFDYTTLIGEGYNLDDISFKAEAALNDLPSGVYELVCEIKTAAYFDIVTLSDRRNLAYEGITIAGKNYRLAVSADRFRLYLTVEDV